MDILAASDANTSGPAGSGFRHALRWFDCTPACLVLLTNGDYRCVYANAACARHAGQRQLLGHAFFDVFPELAEQGLPALFDRIAGLRRPYLGRAMSVGLRRRGALEWHVFDVILQPVFGESGERLGLVLQCAEAGPAGARLTASAISLERMRGVLRRRRRA